MGRLKVKLNSNMSDFDYSNDIAPLKGNYFRDKYAGSSLTQDERRGLELMELKELERQNAIALETAKISSSLRASELAFQEQSLDLEKKKNEFKSQRDALLALPEVTKRLTQIKEDPELDDAQKLIRSAELQSDYAAQMPYSPETKNLFTAFDNSIKLKGAQRDRADNLAFTLIQRGETDAAKKLLEGRSDQAASQLITASDAIAASKKQEAEQKLSVKQQELEQEQNKAMLTARVSLLNDYMSDIKGIKPPKPDTGEIQVGSLKGDGKTATPSKVEPIKYSKEQKIRLQRIVGNVYDNVDEKVLFGLSDEDLYRAAYDGTTRELEALAGFKSPLKARAKDDLRNKFRSNKTE